MQTRIIAYYDTESQIVVFVSLFFSFNYKVNESLTNDNWHHQFPVRSSLVIQWISEPVTWSIPSSSFKNWIYWCLIEGELLYNTVLLLAKYQLESSIGIPMFPLSLTSLPPSFQSQPLKLLQKNTEDFTNVCHPRAGAMLIFSVLFQLFNICDTKANTNNILTHTHKIIQLVIYQ